MVQDSAAFIELAHEANNTYNFANPLDPQKFAEAAASAPAGRAEKLLKDLAEQKDSVKDPTAWVTSALRKAAGGGGGGRGGRGGGGNKRSHSEGPGSGDSQQSDQKLRKRIGWLNGDGGGFGGVIIYDKIVEASGGLAYSEVMKVLKDLEEKKDQVKDPNAWVCSALRKAGGGHSPAAALFSAWGGGPPQPAWAPPIGGGYAAPMRGGDDGKVRKRVDWLNTQGGFGNSLNTTKVLEAASGIDVHEVMQVLKDAEEAIDQLKDPTAYVTAALRKLGGGRGGAGSGAAGGRANPSMAWAGPMSAPDWTGDAQSEDAKLRKRIGWLNGQGGGFEGAINYTKILEASGGLPFSEVFSKLQQLEGKKGEVSDPTAWVCSGLRKAAARADGGGSQMRQLAPQSQTRLSGGGWAASDAQWMGGGGSFGASSIDTETTSKIHKRIKWLNDAQRFNNGIDCEKVIEAAAGLDLTSTLKILKDVEEKSGEVKNPTAWVASALRKAGGGGAGGGSKGAGKAAGFGVRKTIVKGKR